MFNNILKVFVICLGVANTTPISNCVENDVKLSQPIKKSNVQNNYTLTINPQNVVSQNFTNVQTYNSYFPTGNQDNRRYTMTAYNNYINVKGNCYQQYLWKQLQDDNNQTITALFMQNSRLGTDFDILTRTEFTYVYKMTPYNYNVNTALNIEHKISINSWDDSNNNSWYAYEIYFLRTIYRTTTSDLPSESSWDQYIDLQLTQNISHNIIDDVKDVNNGFYYTEEQELKQIGYNDVQLSVWTDIIPVEIVPETDNYFIINYIPMVRMVSGPNENEVTIPMQDYYYDLTPNKTVITGTNIIPDGTYEVVNIPGLMFDVLTMPFAFISQAFNLTLFPGTPYQINIANLFLSVVAIFVFAWLINFYLNHKG